MAISVPVTQAKYALRAAERLQNQGDRDEWPDPDHVGHVDRGRVEGGEPTLELR